MWQLAGIQLHLYGIIIGLAILVGYFLVERKAKQLGWSPASLEHQFWVAVVSGLVGARLYHVWSDFELYQSHLLDIFKIWQGGLSIIGAVMGALVGLFLVTKFQKPSRSLVAYADLTVFGLPLAQAVGRVANYVNQELYGLPSTLPWAIYIQPEHRLPGWESVAYFHPLFAYEMIFMIIFGVGVWWIADRYTKKKWTRVGQGWYLYAYLVYYSGVRIGLDFLRIDKQITAFWGLGSNQVVLLLVVLVLAVVGYFFRGNHHEA